MLLHPSVCAQHLGFRKDLGQRPVGFARVCTGCNEELSGVLELKGTREDDVDSNNIGRTGSGFYNSIKGSSSCNVGVDMIILELHGCVHDTCVYYQGTDCTL